MLFSCSPPGGALEQSRGRREGGGSCRSGGGPLGLQWESWSWVTLEALGEGWKPPQPALPQVARREPAAQALQAEEEGGCAGTHWSRKTGRLIDPPTRLFS